MNKVKSICYCGIGVALYFVLSMTMKIPLIAHISLDLGYLVFALYCYKFKNVHGAIVGGFGCMLISIINYGMFPIGWIVGNIFIGLACALFYRREGKYRDIVNIVVTIVAVTIGILGIKTAIECAMFDIPVLVKLPKNGIATLVDAITMSIGVVLSSRIGNRIKVEG